MKLLDKQILQAHAQGNGFSLAELYLQAANERENEGDVDATCFFLTQAYVFALECGSELARDINRRLVAHGREEPLPD